MKMERALWYKESKMVSTEWDPFTVMERNWYTEEWLYAEWSRETQLRFPGVSKWLMQGVSPVKNWAKEQIRATSLSGWD